MVELSPCYTYIVVRYLSEPLHPFSPIEHLAKGYSKLIVTDPKMIEDFDPNEMKVIQYRGLSKRKKLIKPATSSWHNVYRDDEGQFYIVVGRGRQYSYGSIYTFTSSVKIRQMVDQKLVETSRIKRATKNDQLFV